MPGVPVNRGPIESSNTCASRYVCELSTPCTQIRRSTGSSVGNVCADTGAASTPPNVAAATHATRLDAQRRIGALLRVCWSCSRLGHDEQLDVEDERRVARDWRGCVEPALPAVRELRRDHE